jgi:DNA-binding CsgD family transcriptional regulator
MTAPATIAQIILDMARNGCSAWFIAGKAGVSPVTVYRVLHDHGITRWRLRDNKRDRSICFQYQAGASLRQLARQHGISHQRVSQILRTNGVPTRPNTGPR